jgi:pimeloyl-ACP methyl ester carboxylesterase
MKKPLYPSRSEHFPYHERTFMYGDTPVMSFDAGAGPAIVMVHGLGANLTHFEHVAPPLVNAGFRVCGLDLPGFGLSGKPRRDYSIRWLSGAVTALMDHLGIPSATLAGHSLGGLVVADAALHDATRVERLVLISSAGLFQMPLPFQWVARTIMRPGLVAAALERNARRLLEKRVFEERNEKVERFIGRDKLLPTRSVPKWAKKLPAGELEVIERCGHMPIIEKPEQVVARMKAFLARTSAPLPIDTQPHFATR